MNPTSRNIPVLGKRRPRLIYPRFQLKLIGYQVLSTALVLGIVGWQNHRTFSKLTEVGLQVPLAKDHPYFLFLNYQQQLFQSYLLTAFLVGIVISIVSTLVLSHRVAGPIVRLRGYFSEMLKQGQFPEYDLTFRKNDFFEDLPGVVNDALGAVKKSPESVSSLRKIAS